MERLWWNSNHKLFFEGILNLLYLPTFLSQFGRGRANRQKMKRLGDSEPCKITHFTSKSYSTFNRERKHLAKYVSLPTGIYERVGGVDLFNRRNGKITVGKSAIWKTFFFFPSCSWWVFLENLHLLQYNDLKNPSFPFPK